MIGIQYPSEDVMRRLEDIALRTNSDVEELWAIWVHSGRTFLDLYHPLLSWEAYVEEVVQFDYSLPQSLLDLMIEISLFPAQAKVS